MVPHSFVFLFVRAGPSGLGGARLRLDGGRVGPPRLHLYGWVKYGAAVSVSPYVAVYQAIHNFGGRFRRTQKGMSTFLSGPRPTVCPSVDSNRRLSPPPVADHTRPPRTTRPTDPPTRPHCRPHHRRPQLRHNNTGPCLFHSRPLSRNNRLESQRSKSKNPHVPCAHRPAGPPCRASPTYLPTALAPHRHHTDLDRLLRCS